MRKIKTEELKKILYEHQQYLYGAGGKLADLGGVDLGGVDLGGVDLRAANLRGADLHGANLYNADLREANLFNANLCDAYLRGANLTNAVLSNANLSGADFGGVDLSGAVLSSADLSSANLYNADLRGADLRATKLFWANLTGIETNLYTQPINLACPEEGSFVGYKKAAGKIVVLEIPADAKRSSATTAKCRCSKAKVIRIENLDGTPADISAVPSDYDQNFVYKVGKIVEVSNFDDIRWNECSTGIHFFINRQNAVQWKS